MKHPFHANFMLESIDGKDKICVVTLIEDNLVSLEIQDDRDNVLGEIALIVAKGQVKMRVNRTGYSKEPPQEIMLFHL